MKLHFVERSEFCGTKKALKRYFCESKFWKIILTRDSESGSLLLYVNFRESPPHAAVLVSDSGAWLDYPSRPLKRHICTHPSRQIIVHASRHGKNVVVFFVAYLYISAFLSSPSVKIWSSMASSLSFEVMNVLLYSSKQSFVSFLVI